MKISELVKQTKKYERLGRIIEDIEKAIKDFNRIDTVEDGINYATGTITVSGGLCFDGTTAQPKEKFVDVYLNSEASDLVRDNIKLVLEKQLETLKMLRDELEV